jgi:hypothetical protein
LVVPVAFQRGDPRWVARRGALLERATPPPGCPGDEHRTPLPRHIRLALSLSRAVCSPTPLTAACGDLGLMAGPLRPFPAAIC